MGLGLGLGLGWHARWSVLGWVRVGVGVRVRVRDRCSVPLSRRAKVGASQAKRSAFAPTS